MNGVGTAFTLAEMALQSADKIAVPPSSAFVHFSMSGPVLTASVPAWHALAVDERMKVIRSVLQDALSLPNLDGLQWAFSGVLLDRDEAANALDRWERRDLPLLSIIDLCPYRDGVRTIGLAAIANCEILVLCPIEQAHSAMIFAVHAAHHLLDGQAFWPGQHIMAGRLQGVVLDGDNAVPETIRIALATGPVPDRTLVAN
jgi:hypothetical protein